MNTLPPVPPAEFLLRLLMTGSGYDFGLDGRFSLHFDSKPGVLTAVFERSSTPADGYADTTYRFLLLDPPEPEPIYQDIADQVAATRASFWRPDWQQLVVEASSRGADQ